MYVSQIIGLKPTQKCQGKLEKLFSKKTLENLKVDLQKPNPKLGLGFCQTQPSLERGLLCSSEQDKTTRKFTTQ